MFELEFVNFPFSLGDWIRTLARATFACSLKVRAATGSTVHAIRNMLLDLGFCAFL